jgi:hypothetical protein
MRTAFRSIVCLLVFSCPVAAQTATGVEPSATPAGEKPVVESVFPTTTYPTQSRFNFEINGQHFDPDPSHDEVEVQGQGVIQFGSRHRRPPEANPAKPGTPVECAREDPKNYPCLEASQDGRRLVVVGFPRRHPYQGPLQVQVVAGNLSSGYSGSFTLSRVDHRIIVWLTFAIFGLLTYIVYRLVTKGVKGYTVAGRKLSPIAAFLIDKRTDTYSLSKFQLFALTMVAFFGYVYVFLCRTLVQWKFTFPEIPDNYPSLLAISVGTTAAAAGLTANRLTKGAGPVRPSAADFISNGGLVAADRFQFFVWTLIACLGFVALILMQDPATVDGFPSFPNGLLYVMGVSAGGYLGGKAVAKPGPIIKQVKLPQAPPGNPNDDLSVTLIGENLDKNAKVRIDGAQQEVKGVKLTEDGSDILAQATQGPFSNLVMTLSQAAGYFKGDHVFEIVNSDGIGAQKIFTGAPMVITEVKSAAANSVTLTVNDFREGSSARWLDHEVSEPAEIPALDVSLDKDHNVVVKLPPGVKPGVGTLTLVSPLGGTAAITVTIPT